MSVLLGEGGLQGILQVLVAGQLIGGLLHKLLHLGLEEGVELLDFIIALNDVGEVLLRNASSDFTVFLGPLAKFLPLGGITGCCNVGGWLLREHVLDRQNLIKELELRLRSLFVSIRDSLAIEL